MEKQRICRWNHTATVTQGRQILLVGVVLGPEIVGRPSHLYILTRDTSSRSTTADLHEVEAFEKKSACFVKEKNGGNGRVVLLMSERKTLGHSPKAACGPPVYIPAGHHFKGLESATCCGTSLSGFLSVCQTFFRSHNLKYSNCVEVDVVFEFGFEENIHLMAATETCNGSCKCRRVVLQLGFQG